MKDFIAALKKHVSDMRAKANAAMEKFKPLDQAELSREALWGFNHLEYSISAMEEIASKLDEKEKVIDAEVAAEVNKVIAAKVAAGEFLAKADVETAIAAAEKKGKADAEAAFNLRQEEIKTIAARRKEIETAHGAEVAAAISDDSLKGDGFDAVKSELGRRVAALSTLGVTAKDKPKPFAEIACGIAFDDAGKTAFDARLESIKELVGPAGAAGAAASSAAPKQTPGTGQPPAATAAASQGGKPEDAPEEGKVIYGF